MSQLARASSPWRVAVLASMASYLDAGALVTSGLAIGTLYADGMGLSGRTIGTLLGLQTLAFAVGALVGGRLTDRFGRRRVLTTSLALYAGGVAVLAAAPGPSALTVGVLASGLAIGADLPASLAMVNEAAPRGRKGRFVAFSQLMWGAGIVVSAALGAALAPLGVLGGRLLFGHLLVVALVVLALRLALRESAEWSAARRAATSAGAAARPPYGGQLTRPVVLAVTATGGYYAAWNLGANTLGQYTPFLWVELTGGSASTSSLLTAAALPLGLVGALAFLRVVDTGARRRWFVTCTVLSLAAWSLPVLAGPTQPALVALVLLFTLSAAASGEVVYKVWTQELVPTLLRGSAQGLTMAVARVLAGLFSLVTPTLVQADARLFFGLMLVLAGVAAGVGLVGVPRSPTPAGGPSRAHRSAAPDRPRAAL